jgi:vitamin B12 transporter
VLTSGGPGGVSSVFMRGVSSSQTLILVDGIRVNDANTSYGSFLGGADLTGLGRLEVVRGPQSTLYGGAAIGGVVSMDATRGRGPGQAQLELEGGSFSSWRGGLTFSAGSERTGLSAAITANGTDNQRHPNGWDQRTQLVRFDQRVFAGLSVGASFRGLQHRYASPGDIRSSNTTPAGTTVFESNLGTVWIEPHRVGLEESSRGRRAGTVYPGHRPLQRQSRIQVQPRQLPSSARLAELVRVSPTVLLVAGANREWSTATSDGNALDERLLAFYALAQVSPIAPVTLTAGARSDDYTTFDHAVTWRVTGAWNIGGTTKLRASYGTGFMPPGLSARFGSVFQAPNPGIRPERSRGWDAGLDQSLPGGKGSISVTWFRNTLRDLIVFEGADFPALGREVNLDRARSSGLEIGGTTRHRNDGRARSMDDSLAKSLSENDPSLARLIRRPRHTLAADLGLGIARRARVGAGAVVVLDRQDTDFNSFPAVRVNPGDYALARMYASYDLTARVAIQARAENLFDTRYEPVYGFPGLRRGFTAAATLRF